MQPRRSLVIAAACVAALGWVAAAQVGPSVEFVTIPGGTFVMGDHHDGLIDAPLHTVTLSAFAMSTYETTNAQYVVFLNAAKTAGQVTVAAGGVVSGWGDDLCDTTTSSSYSQITYNGGVFGVVAGKDDYPMVMVSWFGAKAFCDWYGYRLPTEAEWEYAARGGQASPYYRFPWGDTIQHAQANYLSTGTYSYDTSPTLGYHPTFDTGVEPYTSPVGYFAAVGYGLHDMAGNVWDWCSDWYSSTYYGVSPTMNPQGSATGSSRVLRGGSWGSGASIARCAYRGDFTPSTQGSSYGFRVALDIQPELVRVPAGAFAYQNAVDPNDWVWLRSFEIGKYEVTNSDYCLFLNASDPNGEHWDVNQEIARSGAISPYSYTVQPGRDGYPVRYVTAIDAQAYCDWLSSVSGDTYRLPTEQEWEKAAGWDADPNVPNPNPGPLWTYGYQQDVIDCSWANYDPGVPCVNDTTPVGYYDGTDGRNDAHSYYGCYDMSGNLYEWTTSQYDATRTVVRGGNWHGIALGCEVTNRAYAEPAWREDSLGFRVIRESAPVLVSSDPAMDGTLSKAQNNGISLVFDKAITLPADAPVSIKAIAGGPELSAQFSCAVEPDGVTLTITENGEAMTNLVWYRVEPVEGFDVMPFTLDVCTLRGDATGDGWVLASDLGRIWSHNAEMTDGRYDINGDGQVLAADLGLAWSFNAWHSPAKNVLPAKPSV